ncbi:ABC transporter substrate-binding protein [Cohnella herbarum]|uniref:ABC transporter substrate-binding protein n=1 Tax=Cohnella herbarum TaxID=2728023 RepID=A0A7Z2VJZ0_9BACL|nr:ABC transporter substrate-binding protein [Cohnella herbarum]QJD84447.1 ABC transporter substrate-binding protein [Cohnella herbarum]
MKKWTALLALIVLSVSLAACSGNDKNDEGAAESGGKLKEVSFGMMPYYDYAPWALAENQGFFEQEGIKFKSTMFPVEGNVAPALINGSIDIGGFGDTPSITLASQFQDLRMVSFLNIFKGFAIMANKKGDFKTYEQFLKESNDPKQAAIETGKQLKGKSIVTTSGAAFYMVLEQALVNAGLTMDDVKLIDMEPDVGVSAFISGTGDFYLGGLPQREKLQGEGYPALISGDEIGPGAVMLAGLATTKKYADKNPETIKSLQKVWFKTMDYMKSNPDEAYAFLAKWSNEQNGGKSTADDAKKFIEAYVIFAKSPEDAKALFYDENSSTSWKQRYEYLVKYHEETDIIKKDSVKINDLVLAESIFQSLQQE